MTSTACALTPLIISHLEVKRVRRIDNNRLSEFVASDELEVGRVEIDGDIANANKCNLFALSTPGNVILFKGDSDKTDVDH